MTNLLTEMSETFRRKLRRFGLFCPIGNSPVVPIPVESPQKCIYIADKLKKRVSAIRPPTVPPRGNRIRLSLFRGFFPFKKITSDESPSWLKSITVINGWGIPEEWIQKQLKKRYPYNPTSVIAPIPNWEEKTDLNWNTKLHAYSLGTLLVAPTKLPRILSSIHFYAPILKKIWFKS